jgi:hypothetical protein
MTAPGPGYSRLVAIFALLALAMGGIGRGIYAPVVDALRQRQHDELLAVAQLKAAQLEDWLAEQKTRARIRATDAFFSEAVEAWRSRPDADLEARLRSQFAMDRRSLGYTGIALLDAQGQVLLHAGEATPEPQGLAEPVRRALDQDTVAVIDLHAHPDGIPHLGFVVPVGNAGRPARAVLHLDVRADAGLYERIRAWPRHSESGEVTIVRRDGDSVLYLSDLRLRPGAALKLRIPLSTPDLPAAQALRNGPGVHEGRDYRGVPVLAANHPVAGTPWVVIAKIDREEVYAGPACWQCLHGVSAVWETPWSRHVRRPPSIASKAVSAPCSPASGTVSSPPTRRAASSFSTRRRNA